MYVFSFMRSVGSSLRPSFSQCDSLCESVSQSAVVLSSVRSFISSGLFCKMGRKFSTKVPKFGILSQHQLPAHTASLALRKNIRVFNKIRFGLKPHTRSPDICRYIVMRGGLCYKPGGFLRSPRQVDCVNFYLLLKYGND